MIKITLVNLKGPLKQAFCEVFESHSMPKEEIWANRESFELESLVADVEDPDFWKTVQSDCFISRGYSYLCLSNMHLDIPVVEPPFFIFDAINAMQECKRLYPDKKIAMIASRRSLFGTQDVARLLGLDIHFYYVPIQAHLVESEKCIRRAIADGCEVIVAGAQIIEQVPFSPDLKCVIITVCEESVYNALTEAKRLAIIYRHEREQSQNIQTILDAVHDGILAVNQEHRVLICNQIAAQHLGLKKESLAGQDIRDLSRIQPFAELLSSGTAASGSLLDFRGKTFAVNKADSVLDGRCIGSILTFRDITEVQELERKIRNKIKQEGHLAKHTFDDIIGNSPALRDAVHKAREFAHSESNLLIVGETGVGKEIFAQSIHNDSARRNGAFVAVNCAALAENLLESELFGYVDGAFTGAVKGGHPGLFELAQGGTIFLDEISEISPNLQAKLLRVLQEREVRRVGSNYVIPINIRVICATNRDLLQEVQEKRFRNDLYYRLNVLQLFIPPLRQRGEDCILLMEHAIQQQCLQLGREPVQLTPGACRRLLAYPWPGNVRELVNASERICVLEKGPEIGEEKLDDILRDHPLAHPDSLSQPDSSCDVQPDSPPQPSTGAAAD